MSDDASTPAGPMWDSDDQPSRPSVMVASAEALPLRTEEVDHPSIPEGSVGLGSFIRGRLVGRQAMSRETVPTYRALLDTPRRLAYLAFEKDDGSVEGRIAALIPPSEVMELDTPGPPDEEEEEPWKASVSTWDPPDSSYGEQKQELDDENHVALLPLGVVVRLVQRRTHPDDLAAEAADVLRSIVTRGSVEVVDQFLDTI